MNRCLYCCNRLYQPFYKFNGDTHDYCGLSGEWVMCSNVSCNMFNKNNGDRMELHVDNVNDVIDGMDLESKYVVFDDYKRIMIIFGCNGLRCHLDIGAVESKLKEFFDVKVETHDDKVILVLTEKRTVKELIDDLRNAFKVKKDLQLKIEKQDEIINDLEKRLSL